MLITYNGWFGPNNGCSRIPAGSPKNSCLFTDHKSRNKKFVARKNTHRGLQFPPLKSPTPMYQ